MLISRYFDTSIVSEVDTAELAFSYNRQNEPLDKGCLPVAGCQRYLRRSGTFDNGSSFLDIFNTRGTVYTAGKFILHFRSDKRF